MKFYHKIAFCQVGANHDLPEIRLSRYGKIVDEIINFLPERFDIDVVDYVIMPNHIHMVVFITNFDGWANRDLPLRHSMLSNMVGYLKMNASKRFHSFDNSQKFWQRSFHDHIIRNQDEYRKILMYIENNPKSWSKDRFYTSGEYNA